MSTRPSTSQRLLAAAAAMISVALVVAGSTVIGAGPTSPPPEPEAVPATTLTMCQLAERDDRVAQLTLGRADEPADGELSAGNLGGEKAWELAAGTGVSAEVKTGPILVRAHTKQPIPHGAALTTSATSGPGRGLAAQACVEPSAEHWFVGLSADEDHRSALVISNPDQDEAEVAVQWWGEKGPVQAAASSGISVPPHGTRTVHLEGFVDEPGLLSARVVATSGRVAVVADEEFSTEQTPSGADWMAPTAEPASSQVIPGVPAGGGPRDLVLVNPDDRTLPVTLHVMGPEGPYIPGDADVIEVRPQSTVRVPLPETLAGEPVSLELSAEREFAASVLARSGDGEAASDVSRPVATAGLSSKAQGTGLAVVRADGAGTVYVANAGAEDAEVVATAFSGDGKEVAEDTISVASRASGEVALDEDAAFVLIEADGADVHAAVGWQRTTGEVAQLAWLPLTGTAEPTYASSVQHDPSVGR